jgi:hypothetical protein
MRHSIGLACLLAALSVAADDCAPVIVLPLMPHPAEYSSFPQYREAMQAWQMMAKSIMARGGTIQPPDMPQPAYFNSPEHYQEALRAWQSLFQ